MAIERGKLQNLIFDNQALASHRAMAAILGVILRLPPVKQALASRQLRSGTWSDFWGQTPKPNRPCQPFTHDFTGPHSMSGSSDPNVRRYSWISTTSPSART